MIARFVTTSVLSKEPWSTFRHTSEVKGHVYGVLNGQKYEFLAFAGKLDNACAHSVYQALSPTLKGPGYEASFEPGVDEQNAHTGIIYTIGGNDEY